MFTLYTNSTTLVDTSLYTYVDIQMSKNAIRGIKHGMHQTRNK